MRSGDRRRDQGFWRRLGRGFRHVLDALEALETVGLVLRIVTAPFRFLAKVLDGFW